MDSRDRGLIAHNHATRPKKLYRANRSDKLSLVKDLDAFRAVAPAEMRLALELALWTGQRQSDLLRLCWSNYDGERITLRQGKRHRKVDMRVPRALKSILDTTDRRAMTILTSAAGKPWRVEPKPTHFQHHWRAATLAAGLDATTFSRSSRNNLHPSRGGRSDPSGDRRCAWLDCDYGQPNAGYIPSHDRSLERRCGGKTGENGTHNCGTKCGMSRRIRAKCWLGRQDSNLRMPVPKTGALPLGDAPAGSPHVRERALIDKAPAKGSAVEVAFDRSCQRQSRLLRRSPLW